MFWLLVLGIAAAAGFGIWSLVKAVRRMTTVPGKSFRGMLPALTAEEADLAQRLEYHVRYLADEVGVRHLDVPGSLEAAGARIVRELTSCGLTVQEQRYKLDGHSLVNYEVVLPGTTRPDEIVVLGAHYDTHLDSPGADDNASGVASVIEMARRLKDTKMDRTVRFVIFTAEERPHGQNGTMGSQIYARRCRQRNENIVGMLAIESLGYYSDDRGSQKYPPPLNFIYPSEGNFIGFVGNHASRPLLDQCLSVFRQTTQFPSEGIASWEWVPGVSSSDHDPFWKEGYPGLMVTCTAPFRNPHYHKPTDTADTLSYDRMAKVVAGLIRVTKSVATAQ